MLKRDLVLVVALIVLVFGASVGAGTLVSWQGGFRVDYPDQWSRIDYDMASRALITLGADPSTLDFEAVLADSAAQPFFIGEYCIITIDSLQTVNNEVIDSTLSALTNAFELYFERGSAIDFLADAPARMAIYDHDLRLAVVATEILNEQQQLFKRNILAVKFYDAGAASFYYFTPDTAYAERAARFGQLLASFSTDSLDVETEPVKVADIDPEKLAEEEAQDGSSGLFTGIPVAIIVALVVIFTARARRKKRNAG